MNKVIYFALPLVVLVGIYSSHTSNEMSGYFQAYNIKNSNEILILSIDNSTYKQGQEISFLGKVNHYDQGAKVHIKIIDPFNNVVSDFNELINRFGIFGGSFSIPGGFSDGKYLITAFYDGDRSNKLVSLGINISDTPRGTVYISIPGGASTEGSKINFNPKSVTVPGGTRIFWVNNDNTVHTVISGKIYDNGTYAPDNHFKGGYITPGDQLMISTSPGKYQYFCKLHPWLTGTISATGTPATAKNSAKPVVAPAKTAVKPSANPKPFAYLNNALLSIWKERKDLQKSYPEVAKGKLGNLTQWATKTGWNQDQRLSLLIPPGKTPSYLDSVLVSMWKESPNLQKAYPEVAKGDLTKLKRWATTTGWYQDKRLSALIPRGKIPSYTENALLSVWKERKDLKQSYPEVAKGNLDGLTQWAITTGWNQDKRLSALIPPGKTPTYLDSVLVSIWKERSDLQKSYPEVANGNLTKIKNWATTTGWNEDKRLSVLVPQGKVPKY